MNGRLIKVTCQSCDYYQSAIPPLPPKLPYPFNAENDWIVSIWPGYFQKCQNQKSPIEGAQKERGMGN
jgi:hypothetical protein